ncbi:MAG: RHS repeat domain-containing protein [Dehalococcoidia bacterium]
MADAAGTTVWRWDQQEPFGNSPANEDPDANSVAFDLPLRLPGQRYDAETALHYNYFRDYDPSIGRYGESDPIGLGGGLNTYAYAASSPLNLGDFWGLVSQGIADYLGGLGGKAAKEAADAIINMLGTPGAAGQDVAVRLCLRYAGRKPKNLFDDCTQECFRILEAITSQSKAASGWLVKCTQACEDYFPRCNRQKTSMACL